MNLLQKAPAGFDGVNRAFAMARHMPTTHQLGLKIGLVHEGVLLATGALDGYRQVNLFAQHMRQLGYGEHLLGGDDDMHGCDMLFALPAAEVDTDPSFIRRAVPQLWPLPR